MQVQPLNANPPESIAAKTFAVIAGPTLVTFIPVAAAPAMPAMAAQFAGQSDGAFFAQMVMAAPAAMVILSATLSGVISEIVGRRRLLLASLLLYVLAGAACFLIDDSTALILARLALGLAGGGILTTSMTFAGDFPEGGHRERVLGFVVASSSLNAMLVMSLGGYAVDLYGWHAPFLLYLLGLPVFAIVWFGLRNHAHPRHEHNLMAPLRALWPIYLILMFLTVAMFMGPTQGHFLLVEDGVASAGERGMLVSIVSLAATISAACFGRLSAVLSERGLLVLTAFCYGAGTIIAGASHDLVVVAIGFAIAGVAAGITEPTTAMILLARAPESMRGRAMGLLLSALFLGQFLNPLLVSPLQHAVGIHGAFVVVGVVLLALAVASYWLAAAHLKRTGTLQSAVKA